eukprot:CAMPEP_0113847162 /NCGR_PEP_ID=MMETSP0372-20130328/1717_1 /TAXON_ID=340204 /ORGANISM="Lankesteria abbotti" /LENGTH=278 /DNA_ID=CAMNT_0000816401 /DNA_START=231 /DNA_END=1068 /DNA_ORIENTATION=+ /assembly_acc=CAM_ASM_000359
MCAERNWVFYNSEFTSVYGHVPPCQHHYAAYHGIDEWKQRQQEAARTKQYQPLPRPCGSDTYGDRREDGIERHGGIEKSGSDEAGGARTDLTQSLRSLPSVVIRRVKGKPAVDGENASLHGEEAERPIVLYADAANDNGVSVGKADTYTFSQYSMLSRGYSTKYKTAFDSHVNTSLPPEVFDNHDLLSGMDDYGSPKSIMPRVMERKRGKSVEWNLTESICSTHYGRDGSQTTPASQTSMATKPVIKRSNLRRCTLATALKKEARRELERIAPARLPA